MFIWVLFPSQVPLELEYDVRQYWSNKRRMNQQLSKVSRETSIIHTDTKFIDIWLLQRIYVLLVTFLFIPFSALSDRCPGQHNIHFHWPWVDRPSQWQGCDRSGSSWVVCLCPSFAWLSKEAEVDQTVQHCQWPWNTSTQPQHQQEGRGPREKIGGVNKGRL